MLAALRNRQAVTSWPSAAAFCACVFYLNVVLSLVGWAVLPSVLGLRPTLIVSGSMAPRINAGDVVLTTVTDRAAEVGNVITFRDPGHPERLLTHRVATVEADGSYRTRGDRSGTVDSSPVDPEAVVGVGRFVIPAVGLPAVWIRAGAWWAVLAWMVATGLSALYTRRYHLPALPSVWTLPARHAAAAPLASAPIAATTPAASAPMLPSLRPATAVPVVLVLALVAVTALAGAARATWRAKTANPSNSLAAASSFCTPRTETVLANADARVSFATPGAADGTATTIGVTSKNNQDVRSLVGFALPSKGTCTVTASLRLNASSATTGRTLHALAVSRSWSETVTWNTQPATTGSASATASAGGWISFDVSGQVNAMYGGTAFGLRIMDSAESAAGSGAAQTFSSREGANPPQLVLTFSGTSAPTAPSGLTASTHSSTGIALSWTDNSGGAAGFRVERSPAGVGSWETAASLAAGTTTYTDTGLDPSTAYDYRVRATSSSGTSAASNVATATTLAATTAPAPPTNLTATADGVERIALAWVDNAADEDGYTVQRSRAGAGEWSIVKQLGGNVTSWTDAGLRAATGYDYRVRAHNAGGTSTWSEIASATTASCNTLAAQTLTSVADSLLLQGAGGDTNYGSDPTNFGIRTLDASNGRSLVRFATPTISGGCAVTSATLRVYQSSGDVGRTVQALTVAAAWSESTVTWNTRPGTTGSAVSTVTAVGWDQWDVTTLVGDAGSGAPNGFLLRDSSENNATALRQFLQPREAANPPQLVLRFD